MINKTWHMEKFFSKWLLMAILDFSLTLFSVPGIFYLITTYMPKLKRIGGVGGVTTTKPYYLCVHSYGATIIPTGVPL
jgi:hypothetical protein